MPRVIIILFALVAVAPRIAFAQAAPTVSVSTVDECYVGDTVPFHITIANSVNADPPDLAQLLERDWGVAFVSAQPSTSRFMISVNGRTQEGVNQSLLLAYALTPRRAGEFTIPAIKVEVDGRPLMTQPVRVKVSEPAQAQGLGSSIDLSSAYVGQPFKLTLSWLLSATVEEPVFNLNLPEGAFTVLALPPSTAPGAQPRQLAEVEYVDGPGASRTKARGTLSQVSVDGENRTRFTVEFLLVPKRAGTFECGAVRVDYHAVIGKREPSVFDPLGSRNTITQRRFAQAAPKSIRVLELPAAGRPADFSGLVGQFDLDAECQPRQASVGDPLSFTLVLRSKLPILDPPTIDLTRQSGSEDSLAASFRVPLDPILPQMANDTTIYSAQIRPRTAKITEVPPVELWYFDPVEAKYRAARSNRIPLKVTPAPVVALGSLEGLAEEEDVASAADRPDPSSPAGAAPADERVDGLFPPLGPASVAVPYADETDLTGVLAPAAIAVSLPAALLVAGTILAARRRAAERDPAAWRRRGALRRAERDLHRGTAENPAEVSAAMRRFIADWFDLPEDAVTTGDAVIAVRAVDPVLAARTRAILDSCDRQMFGPDHAAETGRKGEEAITVIREIARATARAGSSRHGAVAPAGGVA